MNATRSRWRGFMFAWILNTKPGEVGSVGSIDAVVGRARGAGGGASVEQRVQERLDAEVVQRAAEEDRGLPRRGCRRRDRSACRRRRCISAASLSSCCRVGADQLCERRIVAAR